MLPTDRTVRRCQNTVKVKENSSWTDPGRVVAVRVAERARRLVAETGRRRRRVAVDVQGRRLGFAAGAVDAVDAVAADRDPRSAADQGVGVAGGGHHGADERHGPAVPRLAPLRRGKVFGREQQLLAQRQVPALVVVVARQRRRRHVGRVRRRTAQQLVLLLSARFQEDGKVPTCFANFSNQPIRA